MQDQIPSWFSRRRDRLAIPGIAAFLAIASIILMTGVGFGASESSEPVVRISGAVAKPMEWTAAQLHDQFASDIRPVHFSSRGAKHSAGCIPILAILKSAGVPVQITEDPKADPKVKNLPLRLVLIVRARDGYTAAFSLAELLPEIGNREAWLALDLDGKPLSEVDGPARLMVPGDQKAGRWVHGMASITIIDSGQFTARQKSDSTRPSGS
jgi:DMSO/TMAO reductase YedYZ molybdopterin-dependent catalytic subunit